MIDILISLSLLVGFILGYKDGFLRKLVGFIGFILAIILATLFKNDFGLFIEKHFDIEYYFAEILAGILIFFTTIFVFTILKRVIHPFDKINSLINKLIGGIIGAFQILFFVSAIFLLLDLFELPRDASKENSVLYEFTYSIVPSTFNLLKDYAPDSERIIKEYINEKDTIQ